MINYYSLLVLKQRKGLEYLKAIFLLLAKMSFLSTKHLSNKNEVVPLNLCLFRLKIRYNITWLERQFLDNPLNSVQLHRALFCSQLPQCESGVPYSSMRNI